eukprot:TRINITY_DN26257_c0_g1_i1.p1 TRINITY_DN26257_c0_g1~~TRINITY_DN26257_c0_g1_i1.p1  ORF type:complete len:154 (-),score=29.91 TRINITY_DN26257_c0_g1_i1:200-637(-)
MGSIVDKRGQMIQQDLGGGEKLDISCNKRYIKIMKILYSCKLQDQSKDSQLKVVKRLCENKHSCGFEITRKVFGNTECPGTKDDKMTLWAVHRCDKVCGNGTRGPMVQKDLTGGKILKMTCKGGCIKILKILFSCRMKENQILLN